MKKYLFLHHAKPQKYWGGDIKNIQSLCNGLTSIGHQAEISDEVCKAQDYDFVFLVNATLDLRPFYNYLTLINKEYGVIGFYEDILLFHARSWGLFYYIYSIVQGKDDHGCSFSLERLLENPQLIDYYPIVPKKNFFRSYDVIQNANIYIAQCQTEADCVQRDCPKVTVKSLYPDHKIPEFSKNKVSSEFLTYTGLKSKEYILQVGRLELRKNQLATVIASRNMDVPLVFICTGNLEHKKKMGTLFYDEVFFDAIHRWRKAPTLVISQYHKPFKKGQLKVINMPEGKILSSGMMTSAFAHAGLYVHPAFYELPGLVYIEALVHGVSTVASEWTALKEYFTDSTGRYTLDSRVSYCLPYDLAKLTSLVESSYGKRYLPYKNHPLLLKTEEDIAGDFLNILHESSYVYK